MVVKKNLKKYVKRDYSYLPNYFYFMWDLYFATRNLEGENIQLKETFCCRKNHPHAKYKYKGYCEKYKIWVLISDSPDYKLNDTIVAYKPIYPLGAHTSGSSVSFIALSLFLILVYIIKLANDE